jgi:hypothetical protein
MSIRTAIAHALVKTGLVDEIDMFYPRGLLIVDEIVDIIKIDSRVNENADAPGLWAMVEKATDSYGIDGSNVSGIKPNAQEVIARLRAQGVVITVDQQVVNFLPRREGIDQQQAEDR